MFKGIVIGSVVVALVGGVTFLSYRAEQQDLVEEFELSKFNEEWNNSNDSQRMQLLERELEKMCKLNPEGCRTKQGVKDMVNNKPDLKNIFDDKFSNTFSLKSGFDETCKDIVSQMKIKAFCP